MLKLCKHSKFFSLQGEGYWEVGHKCELGFGKCPDDNDKNCKQFECIDPGENWDLNNFNWDYKPKE